jgi:hypothetical protein
MPGKIKRNTSTPEQKKMWRSAERASEQVETWPDWKTGLKGGNEKALQAMESFGWSLNGAPTIRTVSRLLSDMAHDLSGAIESKSVPEQRVVLRQMMKLRLALDVWENNRE